MVHVEAILYASLAASLFAAFLAMLGKQWLNRYASTDLRGSIVERGRHRQRKLDGINAWYFDSVMGSLPLMLQSALLLLGCALSRYLWEVNTTIASVVLGVTSFGLLFYLFIVIAGAVSEVCPYQTPGSYLIRPLVQKALSAFGRFIRTLMFTPSRSSPLLSDPRGYPYDGPHLFNPPPTYYFFLLPLANYDLGISQPSYWSLPFPSQGV